jgi:hypothetical protein
VFCRKCAPAIPTDDESVVACPKWLAGEGDHFDEVGEVDVLLDSGEVVDVGDVVPQAVHPLADAVERRSVENDDFYGDASGAMPDRHMQNLHKTDKAPASGSPSARLVG